MDEPTFEEAVNGAPANPSAVDEANVSGNIPVEPAEMLLPASIATPDDIDEVTEQAPPAEQHDDPDGRLTISANTVPVNMSYSPISDTSLSEDDNDEYGLQTNANANFDYNAWLQNLIPPKPKMKKTVYRATQNRRCHPTTYKSFTQKAWEKF